MIEQTTREGLGCACLFALIALGFALVVLKSMRE